MPPSVAGASRKREAGPLPPRASPKASRGGLGRRGQVHSLRAGLSRGVARPRSPRHPGVQAHARVRCSGLNRRSVRYRSRNGHRHEVRRPPRARSPAGNLTRFPIFGCGLQKKVGRKAPRGLGRRGRAGRECLLKHQTGRKRAGCDADLLPGAGSLVARSAASSAGLTPRVVGGTWILRS